ncbi:MAG: DUF5362 domain-containing protein [Candidatus Kapabacteria bacterium]|nr:DUF5362 domain-containing protein [Candidatus Kapabacteria bacterium]
MDTPNSIAETTFLFRRGIIKKMNTDMRFVGMFYIIYGAIMCLGIITALIGVPYIIMGIRLRESADSFARYNELGDDMDLNMALEKQQRFYFINKIIMIVALAFFALYIILIIVFLSFMDFSSLLA